jgi:hypothetical protein
MYREKPFNVMPDTATLPYFVKDTTPLPMPVPRLPGLTRMLRGLDVGESGIIPRR